MIQALAGFLARVFIRITGLHVMTLEARRMAAANEARRSVVQAIGTVDADGYADGEVVEARGIGFAEYGGCECGCQDDNGED